MIGCIEDSDRSAAIARRPERAADALPGVGHGDEQAVADPGHLADDGLGSRLSGASVSVRERHRGGAGDGAVAVGKTTPITVTATRASGVTGEIALTVAGLPANVTTDLKTIPAGQNEAKGTITAAAAAAPATVTLTVTGKAKHDGKDITANAPPVPLAVKK